MCVCVRDEFAPEIQCLNFLGVKQLSFEKEAMQE